nr:hypothetical protein [uncultured Flavobacterium sp.]
MKKKFKIKTFSSFSEINSLDDNIDVNIILSDGDVYFGTLITTQNIVTQMKNSDDSFFWIDSMLIVKKLDETNIKKAITEIIDNQYFNKIFFKIGTLELLEGFKKDFDEIIDFDTNW